MQHYQTSIKELSCYKSSSISIFPLLIFLVVIFWGTANILATTSTDDVSEYFYIPSGTNIVIDVDGIIDEIVWKNNANWFTFGTKGYFEVTAMGIHSGNHLFLAFYIRDITEETDSNIDKLIIYIDPANKGESIGNSVKRLTFKRSGGIEFISRDTSNNGWNTDTSVVITSGTDNSNDGYWEAEIKINISSLGVKDLDDFGLFFEVIDYMGPEDEPPYTVHSWPTAFAESDPSDSEIPLVNTWANGSCVGKEGWDSLKQADVFFHKDEYLDLKTDNTDDNLMINCDGTNQISVPLHKKLVAGAVSDVELTFFYAPYGVNCWQEVETTSTVDIDPGDSKIADVSFIPSSIICSGTATEVVLRAEHNFEDDAIKSNNVMIRSRNYVMVENGDTIIRPVIVTNCIFIDGVASLNEQPQQTESPLQFASLITLPPQTPVPDRTETIYLRLNHTELDSSAIKAGSWEFRFIMDQDSVVPQQDSLDPDLYTLELTPGDSVKFKMEITVPTYKPVSFWRGCCALSPFGQSTSRQPINSIPAGKELPLPPVVAQKKVLGHYSAFEFQVYKETKTYREKRKTHHFMRTMGYFGSEIYVKPDYNLWGKFIKFSLILLVLGGGGYYLADKMN